jgi:alpha-glucosidase
LVYSIDFRGKPTFEDSALRIELANQTPLGAMVHITDSTSGSGVDQYKLLTGKTSSVHDAYDNLTVDLAEGVTSGRRFSVEARVYNDAVAFRYRIPQQPALQRYQLTQEDTEFRLVTDAISWTLRLPNYQSGYESEYTQQVLSALSNQGGISSYILNGSPALLHLPGVAWAAVALSVLCPSVESMWFCVEGTWIRLIHCRSQGEIAHPLGVNFIYNYRVKWPFRPDNNVKWQTFVSAHLPSSS